MPMYDIWIEGYEATGEHGTAHYICSMDGASFKDACNRAYEQGKFGDSGRYDPSVPSIWACHLFPTEEEARASFG